MPIIVDFEYEDGTKQRITYPAQVWRKNDKEVKKLIPSNKKNYKHKSRSRFRNCRY